VLGVGGAGVTGLLDVTVTIADQATVDRVHEIVSPWLTPDQIVISSALQPLH